MRSLFSIFTAVLLCACSSGGTRSTQPEPTEFTPVNYTYVVHKVYPHPTTSYTQGLLYHNGELWEGTGQWGASVIQRIDLSTGKVTPFTQPLPREEFGEGITILNGVVYQLTWQSNTLHRYELTTGRSLADQHYPGEGWGLTTDGQRLYMSNGSEKIYPVEITDGGFTRGKPITVTHSGTPVRLLNELEWINGKIWANIYTTDQICIINPVTGVVEGVVDLAGLLPQEDHTTQTDVLNGIAYDQTTGRIFVTGKNWSKLFQISIQKK